MNILILTLISVIVVLLVFSWMINNRLIERTRLLERGTQLILEWKGVAENLRNITIDLMMEHKTLIHSGKVRNMYECCDSTLLFMFTSDRISAFDMPIPTPIPGRGKILNKVSKYWFNKLYHIIPNHLVADRDDGYVVVQRLKPLPIEAIVRGYIIGSGWKDYQETGSICGIELPTGLQQAEKLPKVIYTPSTKAEHDENISFERTVELLGIKLATQVRDISIQLYTEASIIALKKGIIIADTKFEFGLDESGDLYLIDECLTPDSSRYWDVDNYVVGTSPPSFDKQILRDYLLEQKVDGVPDVELPPEIINKIFNQYEDICNRLTN